MAILPSAGVRVSSVVLTISFIDPLFPTKPIAKLSHTFET